MYADEITPEKEAEVTEEEAELTEEEAEDRVRAALIAEIRRQLPRLSQDINFDRWSMEKLTALVKRHEDNMEWARQWMANRNNKTALVGSE
jgi:hypothetical protein